MSLFNLQTNSVFRDRQCCISRASVADDPETEVGWHSKASSLNVGTTLGEDWWTNSWERWFAECSWKMNWEDSREGWRVVELIILLKMKIAKPVRDANQGLQYCHILWYKRYLMIQQPTHSQLKVNFFFWHWIQDLSSIRPLLPGTVIFFF